MKTRLLLLIAVGSLTVLGAAAADWPQWRGPNRDAKVTDFKAPATWPKELTKKWSVNVGNGVATPALVGDKLYTFTREGIDPQNPEPGEEVIRCLNAITGSEIWKKAYKAPFRPSADRAFPGPRSSPAVANGKVVTLGASGTLSCWDAATGEQKWQKEDFRGYPRFHVSCSPIIIDGLVVAALGGPSEGAVVAYDLATGNQKWTWKGPAPSYSSPMLMTVGGTKLIIAQVSDGIVALDAADGKKVWETLFEGQGGNPYNASSPVVVGDELIFAPSAQGIKAVKLEKQGDKITSKETFSKPDTVLEYNTPIIKGNLLFGISGTYEFFCFDVPSGKKLWTAPAPRPSGGAMAGGGGGKGGGKGGGGGGKGGPPGKGGGRGMGGRPEGYGSIVDAGSVLFSLTPAGQLIVMQPSDKEFKEIAKYTVGEFKGPGKGTYAYPIVAGNRIYIKDDDSVTMWTIN
jgi:outer membrane protein assembly factor BamB